MRQDILVSLKMRSPEVVVTSFNRPNLTYRVIPAKEKKHKLPRILDVIRATPPPGIVYATTRKECEELAAGLRRSGVDAAAYHAGMGSADRVNIQERFMTDELAVVVATIAFGMGVDKPNVRFVIHSSVPGSLLPTSRSPGAPAGTGRDRSASCCIAAPTSAGASGWLRLAKQESVRSPLSSGLFPGWRAVEGSTCRLLRSRR